MVNAINEAIYKAMEDDSFKAKLLKDANEAVLELTGEKIPVKVTIHDADEKNLVFILQKWNPEGELDEDSLETVSGGVKGGQRMLCYGAPYPPDILCTYIIKDRSTKLIKERWDGKRFIPY